MKRFDQISSPPRQRNPRHTTDGDRLLSDGINRVERQALAWQMRMAKALKQHARRQARKDRVRLYADD